MAFLYPKKNSPFWYIRFVDENGIVRNRSTRLRKDCKDETNDAKLLRARLEIEERRRAVHAADHSGWAFALEFIQNQKSVSKRSRDHYLGRWKNVGRWLQLERVLSPAQVTHKHVDDYLKWRSSQVKPSSGKKVSWNTALLDVALWKSVMGKALWLGMVEWNPLSRHGFRREDVKALKPEITDVEFDVIRDALEKENVLWMKDSFLIATHTGCRLRETVIPLACIDLKQGFITFPCPKGGRRKAYSVPMPTALIPYFEQMVRNKREVSLELPFQPSRYWRSFFIRIGMPHLCFHCLRVTKITRLWRAGVPRKMAMRLVNHDSERVHMDYERYTVEDLRKWANTGSYKIHEV